MISRWTFEKNLSIYFRVTALCKFWQFNLVSKILARGMKLGQLIGMMSRLPLSTFVSSPKRFMELRHFAILAIFRGSKCWGHRVLQTPALVFIFAWLLRTILTWRYLFHIEPIGTWPWSDCDDSRYQTCVQKSAFDDVACKQILISTSTAK